ncbi:MAG: LbtU family siderophore porin [Desulfobulbaceae bacterium]|nr:LbtU family siderophore porin [Desulfobulbaceae bacterium]
MTKKLNKTLALTAAGMLCLFNTLPAQAAPAKSEMEQLKQQVQQLLQQNQQLNQRLTEMEKKQLPAPTATAEATPPEHEVARNKAVIEEEVARQLKEKGGQRINDFVTLSGSIEGDYKLGKDFAGTHTSAFVLDTVELIMDVKVTDWATGKIVVDYDGDDEDRLYIDEAHITLGKTESFPFFLTGGKVYAPFGDFSTNMIQDPLTLTLGEIVEKGAIAGFEHNGFTGTVFAYNGIDENDPADPDPKNDTINGYGASLAYSYEKEEAAVNAGISWVNNIASSGGISDWLPTASNGETMLSESVSGLSLNLGGKYGPFSLLTEYTTALDSFTAAELPYGAGEGAEPRAWNSELAYTTALLNKETVFAIGYQKSWEAVALALPEQRYSTSAAMNIFDGTTVILEYYLDKDYSLSDGGTDDDGYGFTTRLAYEF